MASLHRAQAPDRSPAAFVAPAQFARTAPGCTLLAAACLLALNLVLSLPPAMAALVAQSASDICAAAADPCVVTQEVRVADGSRLDFGLRTLWIDGAGVLDFGAGSGEIRCGRFEASVSGTALRVRGATGDGSAGGTVELLVHKRCLLAPATACLVDADCPPAGGTCSGGDGAAMIAGSILGNADRPGHFTIRAAGDVVLARGASLAASRSQSDGGSLELESTTGSVTVAGAVNVSGGGSGSGGAFSVFAARDIAIDETITATGGEYDGGAVTLAADGDVNIHDDIEADSMSGAGFGGEIDVSAGNDITIVGGGPSNNLTLGCDGHQSAENFGGDGGTQVFDAGGSIVVSPLVRLRSNGAPPDGFADSISFFAGGDVVIDGGVVARGRGAMSGGGLVEIVADGRIVSGAAAFFDLAGPAAGGDLLLESASDLAFAAAVDVSGGSSGVGGRVVAISGGDADVSGPWTTAGGPSLFSVGELFLEACHVRVTAPLVNSAASGRNRIAARESIAILPGGSVLASGTGAANAFRYRSAARPPVVQGTVMPAASLAIDASLAGCPVCGNAQLDAAEGCDDGNLSNGDGCSARCQDEGCEAQSIGYPLLPLCSDDNECTDDRCDAAVHRCVHVQGDCSDAVACTLDSCSGNRCLHEPQHGTCDDGNACTADQCSAAHGCVHPSQAAPCDDGVYCNGADACRDGECVQHEGDPCAAGPECEHTCNESSRSCLAPFGAGCSDDGNVCTDDACDGLGRCMHEANRAACDDAVFCNGADSCRDAQCAVHGGDPCLAASGCGGACREDSDRCLAADEVCPDDGNPCTDDSCDAAGNCIRAPVVHACDDHDFCTVEDACTDGMCGAPPAPTLVVSSLKVRPGRGIRDDRMVARASFAASVLAVDPPDTNLRVVLSDGQSRPLVDETIAAGSFTGNGGSWKFKAEAAEGIVRATVDIGADGRLVLVRVRVEGAELSRSAADGTLSLALLFGDEPGLSPCASSGDLLCVHGRTKSRCVTPQGESAG